MDEKRSKVFSILFFFHRFLSSAMCSSIANGKMLSSVSGSDGTFHDPKISRHNYWLIDCVVFPRSSIPFQALDLSLGREKNTTSLRDRATELMASIFDTSASRLSGCGIKIYSPHAIQLAMRDIETEIKSGYVKPDKLFYNEKMVRKFSKREMGSIEEVQRKEGQAQSSRLSRDKNRFLGERMKEEVQELTTILHMHIARLVNLECYVNETLVRNGHSPIDWNIVWLDDAQKTDDLDKDNDGNEDRIGDVSTAASDCGENDFDVSQMIEFYQRMVDSYETMCASDDAIIHESHANSMWWWQRILCAHQSVNRRRNNEKQNPQNPIQIHLCGSAFFDIC